MHSLDFLRSFLRAKTLPPTKMAPPIRLVVPLEILRFLKVLSSITNIRFNPTKNRQLLGILLAFNEITALYANVNPTGLIFSRWSKASEKTYY